MITFKRFLESVSGSDIPETALKSQKGLKKYSKLLGVSISDLKKIEDEEMADLIKNIGKYDFVPDSKFDRRELARGIEVELEHVNSRVIAKLIAKDHLSEISDYYSRLDKMERDAR